MAEAVIMPQVGQDIETATILEWFKKEMEPVQKGDIIATVESDKATFDVEAYHSGWTLESALGNFRKAQAYIRKGLEIYRPEAHHGNIHIHGHDPGVCARSTSGLNLWLLGFPDQAKKSALEGAALSKQFRHPFTTCTALWGLTWVLNLRGDAEAASQHAQAWHAVAEEHGLAWFIPNALLIWGAAQVQQGERDILFVAYLFPDRQALLSILQRLV